MFLNETRGSFGMFSRAGRHSTERFHILMKKDELIAGEKKSKGTSDFDEDKEISDFDDDYEMKIVKEHKKADNLKASDIPRKKVNYPNNTRLEKEKNTCQVLKFSNKFRRKKENYRG